MEKSENLVRSSWRRAALEVRVEIVGAKMGMHINGNAEKFLSVTSSWYRWTVWDFLDPIGHNGFENAKGRSTGFFS